MSLTTAGNLTVSNNLIINGKTTLGDSLISNSSGQFSSLSTTGNITCSNVSTTTSLSCPHASFSCSSISSSGSVSGGSITSTGTINEFSALNLTGSNTEIIQSGVAGSNLLSKTTIQGDLTVNGNIVFSNNSQGAFSITDGENINMSGAMITQQYANVSGTSNYNLNSTLLATQFVGNISQTTNNGNTNNVNSLQTTSFNGNVTFLYNLIVNSVTLSPTVLSYLNNVSSNIQTQLNNIVATFTNYANLSSSNTFPNTNTFNSNINLNANLVTNSTTITPTFLSYLNNVTSNIQTQLNNIVTTFANYANLSSSNTFTNTNTFNSTVQTSNLLITETVGTGPYSNPKTLGVIPSSTPFGNATNGSLVIRHSDSGGVSSILFPSTVNNGSDFGYIQYYDNLPYSNSITSEVIVLLEQKMIMLLVQVLID